MSTYVLPKSLWIKLLKPVAYILNRVSSKSVSKTPFELSPGRKPRLNHFHISPTESKYTIVS